jgi:hypothetical protein
MITSAKKLYIGNNPVEKAAALHSYPKLRAKGCAD